MSSITGSFHTITTTLPCKQCLHVLLLICHDDETVSIFQPIKLKHSSCTADKLEVMILIINK